MQKLYLFNAMHPRGTIMSKQMKRMLIIVGIVFGIIFGVYIIKKGLMMWFMGHYQSPPVTVSSTVATSKTWQSYLTSVGTLRAVNGVEVSTEIPGIIKEIHFVSGQFVKKGDLLILLDTSVEEAELKDRQAQLKLARINFNREQTLAKKNIIPQATFDTTIAKLEQAEAGVQAIEARINLKTITSPFDGKIGIRKIDIGDYVPAGTEMVTLESFDPLFVNFTLPEQYASDLYLEQRVDVSVNLPGNKAIPGKVTAINSIVDTTTRNILAQATIPNHDFQLYPGMFANVKIWLREKKNVITLPQTCISYSLHGDSIFIIKNESKDKNKPDFRVYRQYVKVGERRDNEVIIIDGVKAGDQVVSAGQLKLQNGTNVLIDNSVQLN